MNEQELDEHLRRARPQTMRRGDALGARQEALLQRIVDNEPLPLRVRALTPRWSTRWTRMVLPVRGAAAFLAVIALVVVLGSVALIQSQPVMAATPPVLVTEPVQGTPTELLLAIGESVRQEHHGSGALIRFQYWALAFEAEGGAPPRYIAPEIQEIHRHPDGGAHVEVRAGKSYQPNGVPVPDPTPAPGTLIWSIDRTAEEEESVLAMPPSRADEYAAYFARNAPVPAVASGDYFSAVRGLLSVQSLSSDQEAAMIEFLATLPDIRVDGAVTDRLGRRGISFSTDSRAPGKYRETLVLSASRGVVSYENTYIGSTRKDLRAPAVIDYVAWTTPKGTTQ